MLILVGSAVIAFAAIRALIHGPELENLGHRHRRHRLRHRGQPRRSPAGSSGAPARRRARRWRATPRHLRTDAYTSIGVLVGLALVSVTGAEWLDPVVALVIAFAIVVTGARITMGSFRVLVDEALPDDELEAIRDAIEAFADRGVVGYHELRTRRAGARRYVDLHVQFAPRHVARGGAPDRPRAAGRDPTRS